MTFEIGFVLTLLAIALVLFVSERLRMDLVAMLVLAVLAVSGMVSVEQALAGFSNPAVVTVWAMFILSAGLSRSGVADLIGRQMLRVAGVGEARIILTVMITAGLMSAVMNNVGVAALMLPVVMDIARRTGVSPSRLLMPMAYASLLGGLTTLVGTPPNLVASSALEQAGHEGYELFDFSPVGVPALIIGSLFVAYVGRHLLPKEVPESFRQSVQSLDGMLRYNYEVDQHQFRLKVVKGSPLQGKTLEQIGLGAVLGLTVYAVERAGRLLADVGGQFRLQEGDVLWVRGSREEFQHFLHWRALEMARGSEISELLAMQRIAFVELEVAEGSELVGRTSEQVNFASRFAGSIISVRRAGRVMRGGMAGWVFEAGDLVVLETHEENLDRLRDSSCFGLVAVLQGADLDTVYDQDQRLFELQIPEWSNFVGKKISQSGIGGILHLRIVGIARQEGGKYFPVGDDLFQANDKLLVQGNHETQLVLEGLQGLQVCDDDDDDRSGSLTGGELGLVEVTLAPQSSLAGCSVKEVQFRKRYGLQIQAVWRRGTVLSSRLSDVCLELGDAILLSGTEERISDLKLESDFLVLSEHGRDEKEVPSMKQAAVAATIMLGVVGLVMGGVLPIAIAALAGVVVMLLLGCLTMDAAYRAIEWPSVFLIACMIPMGTAMEQTGAAQWLVSGVAEVVEPFGVWGMIFGLYVLTSLATTIVPTTALVLIMAPIAIGMADRFAVSPQVMMMAVAMAASASFTSPISHPANVMVMGPGGYRFFDYVKMGFLLALVVMITVLPLLAMKL